MKFKFTGAQTRFDLRGEELYISLFIKVIERNTSVIEMLYIGEQLGISGLLNIVCNFCKDLLQDEDVMRCNLTAFVGDINKDMALIFTVGASCDKAFVLQDIHRGGDGARLEVEL